MGLIYVKTVKKLGVWKRVSNFFTGWATSGFDKNPVYPAAPEDPWFKGGDQMYRILHFFMGNFGLLALLLKEGSILDPCCEICK
jgi:hypothetical protein